MATKLGIYQDALLHLGRRRLVALTDPRPERLALDDAYDSVLAECLEAGVWHFALLSATLAGTPGTAFGKAYSFDKPADLVHIFGLATDAGFDHALSNDFFNNGTKLYADTTPIYLLYSSNDATNGGGNLTKWTRTFASFVSASLAAWTAIKITGSPALAQHARDLAELRLARALAVNSVSSLPGLRPFNNIARAPNQDMTSPSAVESDPFGKWVMPIKRQAPNGQ